MVKDLNRNLFKSIIYISADEVTFSAQLILWWHLYCLADLIISKSPVKKGREKSLKSKLSSKGFLKNIEISL